MDGIILIDKEEKYTSQDVPEFYSCYATKADCILNQVGNQLLYYGL